MHRHGTFMCCASASPPPSPPRPTPPHPTTPHPHSSLLPCPPAHLARGEQAVLVRLARLDDAVGGHAAREGGVGWRAAGRGGAGRGHVSRRAVGICPAGMHALPARGPAGMAQGSAQQCAAAPRTGWRRGTRQSPSAAGTTRHRSCLRGICRGGVAWRWLALKMLQLAAGSLAASAPTLAARCRRGRCNLPARCGNFFFKAGYP